MEFDAIIAGVNNEIEAWASRAKRNYQPERLIHVPREPGEFLLGRAARKPVDTSGLERNLRPFNESDGCNSFDDIIRAYEDSLTNMD